MSNYSETQWAISLPYKQLLRNTFNEATAGTATGGVHAKLNYQFARAAPATAQIALSDFTIDLLDPANMAITRAFAEAFNLDCAATPSAVVSITIDNFLDPLVHLGASVTPERFHVGKFKSDRVPIELQYSCQNYWVLNGVYY